VIAKSLLAWMVKWSLGLTSVLDLCVFHDYKYLGK